MMALLSPQLLKKEIKKSSMTSSCSLPHTPLNVLKGKKKEDQKNPYLSSLQLLSTLPLKSLKLGQGVGGVLPGPVKLKPEHSDVSPHPCRIEGKV